ncbi:MAG: transferase [Desulfobacteraceae bacterium]|jgi:carbonic anhydrase/acetyltransferase-like protein (isoleucine patch superfamily)
MKELKNLLARIIQRANINLRELNYDITPWIENLVPLNQMSKFYAFYGVTPHHPLNFRFRRSSLAGSYFLGKCRTTNSMLYKSDIRGDELKKRGDVFDFQGMEIPITENEGIDIHDSFLIKTLVHNFSHDPETLEKFFIANTVSTHYANIHGSPMDGTFLGPFSTVDLTTTNDCVIGTYSYVQAGEIGHLNVDPGTVWVRSPGTFNFLYRYPLDKLSRYIHFSAGKLPQGLLMDFVEDRKEAFQRVFDAVNLKLPVEVPKTASVDRFAVIKPKTHISENVLVAQRAFLQNAWLGKGSNAQENCYIINSRLEGFDVTAHGAKIIEADLGQNVFVGFNSFLRGRPGVKLSIGKSCIIMPHTIIDIKKPLAIPEGHLVWGLVTNQQELEANSISLTAMSKIGDSLAKGNMFFEGSGARFVTAFRDRIHHILEANGALYNGANNKGHAQRNQNISFNTIQPYPDGKLAGLYPTISILP